MRRVILSIRDRLDRAGVLLSALCAVHCLAGLLLVTGLGIGGQFLLAPAIHRVGLALAIAVAMLTLGIGVIRHGQRGPLLIGAGGISLMTLALASGHGSAEAVLTVAGVALVAAAHIRNLRIAA